ncbi:IS110 family transposase [Micromonospora sp. LZ34]
MTSDEAVIGGGRFDTDRDGYAAMTKYAEQWPNRVWAIEGCQGIGRHIANRLLADGEQVVDVPPKLSALARVFATGHGRKTDATDAHSIALVGTRTAGLRPLVNDEQLALLGSRSTGAAPSALTTPGWCPSCTNCCWSWSPAGRRRVCPPPRPRHCWPRSGPVTRSAKLDGGSPRS